MTAGALNLAHRIAEQSRPRPRKRRRPFWHYSPAERTGLAGMILLALVLGLLIRG